MILATIAACLVTAVPELEKLQMPCPPGVLEIRAEGDHDLMEVYIKTKGKRGAIEKPQYSFSMLHFMDVALRAYRWMEKEGYDLNEFQYTLEDEDGKYICTVRIEPTSDDQLHFLGGDCAGMGKE